MGERRWLVIMSDGSHATLGRATDPTDAELLQASDALERTGTGGWLVVTDGQYFGTGPLEVMMVRELAPSNVPWDRAVAAFHQTRTLRISSD